MKKILSVLMIMVLLLSLLAGCAKQGPDLEGESPAAELIARYAGDWNGVVAFEECTGKYEESLGNSSTSAIARFIIDQQGNITPFIGLNVEDTPIMNLEAAFAIDRGSILLAGSWIDVAFKDAELSEDQGLLRLTIPIAKEAGSLKLVFRLRRLGDLNWAEEEPHLSAANAEFCKDKSFDELAELNGYQKGDYPAEGSAPAGDAPAEEKPAAGGSLLGSWEAAETAGAIYRFDEGGKGAYIYSGTEMPFTYTDDGSKVSILFEGNSFPNDFNYTIQGNTLQIEDSFGDKVDYIKK